MDEYETLRLRPSRRIAIAATVALLMVVFAIAAVVAQGDLDGKLRAGQDVRVGADETITTDLYVSGGIVTIDGTVEGDLVVTGGNLTLNGAVGGDVLAAGGTVRIGGEVTGDVRAAGGQVVVAGTVGEDALLAGGTLEVGLDGSIGEDLILSGGTVTVTGDVTGSITGIAATYTRTGQVGGTDEVQIQQAQPPFDRTPNLVADAFRHFLSVLLVGLIALWLAPRFMSVAEGAIRRRPLSVLGWGLVGFLGFFLLLVVIPILTILLAVVLGLLGFSGLVGIVVLTGVIAMLALILGFVVGGFFLGDALVGLALARLVAPGDRGVAPGGSVATADADPAAWDTRPLLTGRNVLLMAIGVAVIVIVTSLPVVGGIAHLLVALFGLGAVLYALRWRFWGGRPATAGSGAA